MKILRRSAYALYTNATLPRAWLALACLLYGACSGAGQAPAPDLVGAPSTRQPGQVCITNYQSYASCGTGPWYGSGTAADPWWGDFDAIMTGLTIPGDSICLSTGTFYTLGCPTTSNGTGRVCPKSGQTLDGGTGTAPPPPSVATGLEPSDSAGSTTIALATEATTNDVFWSNANSIRIENLTIDCDPNQGTSFTVKGIVLFGSSCTVSDVTVLHSTGWYNSGGEGFAILVGAIGTTGNTVEGCQVSGSRGGQDAFDGIGFSGGGTVQNNSIVLPTGSGMCINSTYADGATYGWNTCQGGSRGFYSDTGWNHNVLIENNTFEGATDRGLKVGSYTQGGDGFMGISNLTISANTFLPIAGDQTCGISIRNTAGNYPVDNVFVPDNEVSFSSGTYESTFAIDLLAQEVGYPWWEYPTNGVHYFYNGQVTGNKIQLSTPTEPIGENFLMQYWYVSGNTDLSGIPLPSGGPPNGIFPADGTYTNAYYQYWPLPH
ncbi:MAG: hypothetical protein ACLQVX_09365 [Limisphaerales bacterium]